MGRAVYIPYTQALPQSLGQIKFFVRTMRDPSSSVSLIRREVQTVDRGLALRNIQTQMEQLDALLGEERSLAIFAAQGLVMASINLYGTMAYSVTRRTRELDIRMALGAQRRTILWMVLRKMLLMIDRRGHRPGGFCCGAPLISSKLFGVKPTNAVAITIAIVMMLT